MTDMENQIKILNDWLYNTEFLHVDLIEARQSRDAETRAFDRKNRELDVSNKESLLLAEMNKPEIRGSAAVFTDTNQYSGLRTSVETRLKNIKGNVDSAPEELVTDKPKRLTNKQQKLKLLLFLQESEGFEFGKPEVIRNNGIILSLTHCRRRIYEQDVNFSQESDIENIVGIIDRVITGNVSWRPDSWSRLLEVFPASHLITKVLKKKSDDDTI